MYGPFGKFMVDLWLVGSVIFSILFYMNEIGGQ